MGNNKKVRNSLLLVILLSIIAISLGISVAVFNYLGNGTTNNVIQTGRIIFSYSDAENPTGNGINIANAMPISDSLGKVQAGVYEYFDFSVTASTTNTDIAYEIVANKQENSTMPDDYVKIYLTEFNGNTEVETPLTGGAVVPTYSELKDTTNPGLTGKSIYFGEVKAGEVAYGKSFRLRMWIKDSKSDGFDYDSVNEKEYTVKVNVSALGAN